MRETRKISLSQSSRTGAASPGAKRAGIKNKSATNEAHDDERAVMLRLLRQFGEFQGRALPAMEANRSARDVVLFVLEHQISGQRISISQIYHSLPYSKSTTIKCIKGLEKDKAVHISGDIHDARRRLVQLSPQMEKKLVQGLESMVAKWKQYLLS